MARHRTFALTGHGWALDGVRGPGVFAANEGNHHHSEQGGPRGAITHLAMTAVDGVIWEVLDDSGAVEAVATMNGFRSALDRQALTPSAT